MLLYTFQLPIKTISLLHTSWLDPDTSSSLLPLLHFHMELQQSLWYVILLDVLSPCLTQGLFLFEDTNSTRVLSRRLFILQNTVSSSGLELDFSMSSTSSCHSQVIRTFILFLKFFSFKTHHFQHLILCTPQSFPF